MLLQCLYIIALCLLIIILYPGIYAIPVLRFSMEVTLYIVASEGTQERVLKMRLHAFSHDFKLHPV